MSNPAKPNADAASLERRSPPTDPALPVGKRESRHAGRAALSFCHNRAGSALHRTTFGGMTDHRERRLTAELLPRMQSSIVRPQDAVAAKKWIYAR